MGNYPAVSGTSVEQERQANLVEIGDRKLRWAKQNSRQRAEIRALNGQVLVKAGEVQRVHKFDVDGSLILESVTEESAAKLDELNHQIDKLNHQIIAKHLEPSEAGDPPVTPEWIAEQDVAELQAVLDVINPSRRPDEAKESGEPDPTR